MNLALFDFDGTITFKDSFAPFIRLALEHPDAPGGTIRLAPLVIGYKAGFISATVAREKVSAFVFRGRKEADVMDAGLRYARDTLPATIRPKALARIAWHKSQQDVVVVVSAALNVYLAHWCRSLSVELICTELEAVDGVLTGRYRDGDCAGPAKARRIQQRYTLTDFADVYAYGDTSEDAAMLQLANHRFFRWREWSGAVQTKRKADHVDQHPDR